MKVVDAIFENGDIIFPFEIPESAGPIGVIIIFPDDPVDALDWQTEDDWETVLDIPY